MLVQLKFPLQLFMHRVSQLPVGSHLRMRRGRLISALAIYLQRLLWEKTTDLWCFQKLYIGAACDSTSGAPSGQQRNLGGRAPLIRKALVEVSRSKQEDAHLFKVLAQPRSVVLPKGLLYHCLC